MSCPLCPNMKVPCVCIDKPCPCPPQGRPPNDPAKGCPCDTNNCDTCTPKPHCCQPPGDQNAGCSMAEKPCPIIPVTMCGEAEITPCCPMLPCLAPVVPFPCPPTFPDTMDCVRPPPCIPAFPGFPDKLRCTPCAPSFPKPPPPAPKIQCCNPAFSGWHRVPKGHQPCPTAPSVPICSPSCDRPHIHNPPQCKKCKSCSQCKKQ